MSESFWKQDPKIVAVCNTPKVEGRAQNLGLENAASYLAGSMILQNSELCDGSGICFASRCDANASCIQN